MSQELLSRQIEEQIAALGRWKIVLYNDDSTPYEAVIRILIEATGCTLEEAAIETWEAHNHGKADVHFGSKEECDVAARTIASIGVKVEVSREWED